LCDVGARHFTDIETVARLPQLLLQHFDVAPLQVEDGGCRAEDSCRAVTALSSTVCSVTRKVSRADCTCSRLARAVGRLESVVESLGRGDAAAIRRHLADR
jgi:hypothetical protein